MRTQKASLAGLACYFETPAQESPTTCHAQTVRRTHKSFSLLGCLNLKKRIGLFPPELALLGGYA